MPRVLITLFCIALVIYALIDCANADKQYFSARVPKIAWLALIVLLPLLGAVLWLLFKYKEVLRSNKPLSSPDLNRSFNFPRQSGKNSAPVAPDDDPEFLSRLEAQNRRRAYEQRKAEENEQNNPQNSAKPTEKKKAKDDKGEPESKGLYG